MNLRYYERRIKPEHWEEFQELISEDYRAENKDYTSVNSQMAVSPSNQMSIQTAWEYAAEMIAEKYDYDDFEEE